MKVTPTKIQDVLIIEPTVHADERGFFMESFNQRRFNEAVGCSVNFVQDNHSRSLKGVLRGLHYQQHQAQGKLVRVLRGAVYDVAVDLRKSSPTLGQWFGIELSEENKKQLWIPPGLAHGFLVISEFADVLYKTTDYYAPEFEHAIHWSSKRLSIEWPVAALSPILSKKDELAPDFDLETTVVGVD